MYFAIAGSLGLIGRLSFDPVSLPLAMVLSVAGLFAVLRRLREASRPMIAGIGAAWAAGFFGPLVWWMNAVDFWAWIGLTAWMMCCHALIVLAVSLVIGRRGWVLLAPLVWTAGETWRGSWPLHGFPWGRLAYSTLGSPLESLVRYLSMPGTTFVLAVAAALIAAAFTSRRAALATAAALVALWVTAAAIPTGIVGADGTRRMAIIQSGIPGAFLTWPSGAIGIMTIAETRQLDQPVDMILWPENALDVDPIHNRRLGQLITDVSAELRAPILVAGVFDGPTPHTALNTGMVWTSKGPGDSYVKRRPVPFGEYVPFRDTLGPLVPKFDRDIPRDILPGDQPGALHIAGTVVGAQICWDVAFDDVIADNVREGASVLVNQTSNAAFQGTDQAGQQWDISRLRAIETGRYVAVPSTSGITGLVSPSGKVVAKRAPMTPSITVEQVTLASGETPAVRYGGMISLIVSLTAIAALAMALARAAMVRRR